MALESRDEMNERHAKQAIYESAYRRRNHSVQRKQSGSIYPAGVTPRHNRVSRGPAIIATEGMTQ